MKLLKRIFSIAIFWLGPLAVAAGGGWLYLQGGRFISTDNAYLKSEMISISSEISGKVVEVLAADNTRIQHAYLSENITPYSTWLNLELPADTLLPGSSAVLAMIDGEITRQALSIAYINDFKLMMWVVLALVPLVVLLKGTVSKAVTVVKTV